MIETIPLPRNRVLNEEPFQVRMTDLTAWPDQEIVCYFEHNDYNDRWVWQLETAAEGIVIPRSKVVLGRKYRKWPYMAAMFRDKQDTEDRVTTQNLGDQVVLTVLPGPMGGSFPDEADISEEREDEILKRHWFAPIG